ncbi:hypothetical protein [Diaphorobacter limosus]|uniref:Transmembrane protein n=1 Tax=Diaphorobacter limosus TaxID=3036128 RepID=A0ABZ0J383_9BURK|nr:hypothetical protein [Diaphorobacter sp. Y-1]WOO31597.1 hypothetical protein P4826_14425 [Diaphorobacter sp. Y-1]
MTPVDPASLADSPLLAAIAWFYLASNSIRIVTYMPQIIAVWRCTDGARAISLLAWGSWALSHLSGVIYGVLVLHDTFFVVITVINLWGCSSVTGIAAMHRWRWHHKGAPAGTRPVSQAAPTPSARAPRLGALRSVFGWARVLPLLVAAGAGALVAGLWLPLQRPPSTAGGATAAMATPLRHAALPPLPELRANAAMGQPYAAADLIDLLLARYDADGDPQALFEAMLLLDRNWDQPQVLASGVIQQVVQERCPAERLLRHFWICDQGE